VGDSRNRWLSAGIGRSVLVMVLMALLTASIGTGIIPTLVLAAGTSLRDIDWTAALGSDPAVTIDPTAFRPPGEAGPYVKVAVPGARSASATVAALRATSGR
jgi:hypothetical protein